MKKTKLLFATILAAGATFVAASLSAEEKKPAPGGPTAAINAQDCQTAGPGDKNKKMEKVKPGSALPAGELAPGDCKAAAPGDKAVSRKEVAKDAKEAVKTGATKGGGGPN